MRRGALRVLLAVASQPGSSAHSQVGAPILASGNSMRSPCLKLTEHPAAAGARRRVTRARRARESARGPRLVVFRYSLTANLLSVRVSESIVPEHHPPFACVSPWRGRPRWMPRQQHRSSRSALVVEEARVVHPFRRRRIRSHRLWCRTGRVVANVRVAPRCRRSRLRVLGAECADLSSATAAQASGRGDTSDR
jgi:hypothetical protein